MNERYELVFERIQDINRCQEVAEEFRDYFKNVSDYILMAVAVFEKNRKVNGSILEDSSDKDGFSSSEINDLLKQDLNKKLYAGLTDKYNSSYLNPSYAVEKLGEYGQILSAIYAELQSLTAFAYERNEEAILIRMELFVELYGMLANAYADGEEANRDYIIRLYGDFAYDYLSDTMEASVRELYAGEKTIAYDIIESADLSNTDYLYDYGEYISDNEIKLAEYLNSVSQEKIDKMAETFTEGYRLGFVTARKDLSIKETVEIRYPIGFERVVRSAVGLFDKMGLRYVIRRSAVSFVNGRRLLKGGYFAEPANKQFESDHEYDKVLYFNRRFLERKLEAYGNALEKYKEEAGKFGGPAVIESFGVPPFTPESKKEVLKPDGESGKLISEFNVRAGELLNKYVKGEERSFTIIAFPTPEIGENFKEIFDEVIKINTLDYIKYRDIQQLIIDALDKTEYVKIQGMDGNLTDLKVKLWKLANPKAETIFENCVADVNIPVGEVFTSPKLEGTEGLLHIKNVYLNGLPYKDLKLELKEGMISSYICGNYKELKDNKNYIKENLLFQHESLPIGEFAIGTNTTAYVLTKKYGLESVMPILIAEKTGPHFAFGDTCYSHEEDIMTYNPDGKAIVARENSISALRDSEPLKAYFGCHTDITIPYDELGRLYGVCENGEIIDIIRDGRFVLKGTEALNEPLDEWMN